MEIDYNKLKDIGIRAEDRKGDKQKMFCPACHANRKNKADKSLSVDWVKCVAHCHHCDQSFFFGKTEKIGFTPAPAPAAPPSTEPRKPGKLTGEEQPDANMLEWFAGRGIPAQVLQREGISKVCRKMPQTGQVERCIVFPYLLEGELVNRKYRDGRNPYC